MKKIRSQTSLFSCKQVFVFLLGICSFACHQTPSPSSSIITTQGEAEKILPKRDVSSAEKLDLEYLFTQDPLASEQWHLRNTGQSSFAKKAAQAGVDLKMTEALEQGIAGQGVKIAISDTGVEIAHPDLLANINEDLCRNYAQNGPQFQGNPTPESGSPSEAHGTMVAGIIGATDQNSIGIRGIAPRAQIAGFRYLGTPVSKSKMIDQALGEFDIFNYSYGSLQCSIASITRDQIDSIKLGTESLRGGLGALYFKAAGNEWSGTMDNCNSAIPNGKTIRYFGNTNFEAANTLPYISVIGAIGPSGKIASYSTPGANLWVVAPGGEDGANQPAIVTTDLTGCDRGVATTSSSVGSFDNSSEMNPNCDYTSKMRGSSAATPMVSGVSALILSVNPELSWRDVKYILAATADKPLSPPSVSSHPRGQQVPPGFTYQEGWTTNSAGFSFHNWFGFGLINADRAIDMARKYKSDWGALISTIIPTTNESIYKQESRMAIPDYDAEGITDEIMIAHDLIIEGVQLEVTIDHTKAQDLAIELYSPSGTKSIVINPLSGITDSHFKDEIFGTNAFYLEKSIGKWKIKVVDAEKNDQTGVLIKWGLRLFGHKNKSETNEIPLTPSGLSILAQPQGYSILESPIFKWNDPEDGQKILRYDVALIGENGEMLLPWTGIGKQTQIQITKKDHSVRFYKKQNYQLQVRAVARGEAYSKSAFINWVSE